MGKRSNFEKIEKDQYQTIDERAADILKPFLIRDEVEAFAEPCVGKGLLRDQLSSRGFDCLFECDFERDALTTTNKDYEGCSVIVTNPPWTRSILHPMIEHFSSILPTWLLFDADWMHTKQSAGLIDNFCTDIVSVGRLKWIPDTTMSGKDNCAWYRFSRNKRLTKFHGRKEIGPERI